MLGPIGEDMFFRPPVVKSLIPPMLPGLSDEPLAYVLDFFVSVLSASGLFESFNVVSASGIDFGPHYIF